MGKTLDGFPWWSQLTDPDPTTHKPDIYATTDCGEEVCSIWIAGRTGIYTDAADLRRSLPGSRVNGITSGADLVTMLATKGIPTQDLTYPIVGMQRRLRDEIDRGMPAAVLGYWVAPSMLHWVLMLGYGNDAMVAMNPWNGRLTCYRWDTVRALATGDVVQAI